MPIRTPPHNITSAVSKDDVDDFIACNYYKQYEKKTKNKRQKTNG